MPADGVIATEKPAPPPLPLFAIMEAPYGMQSALSIVIPMVLMRNAGVSIEKASALAALATLPATFYFAYAPLVDFFIRRRTWLLLAILCTSLLSSATILFSPATHLSLVSALLFSGTVTGMLISAATGGLMGSLLDAPRKARVGAWVQVGNCGGNSLFFGLLVFLAPRLGRPALALVTMLCMLLPGLVIFALREPARQPSEETYGSVVRGIGRELRTTFLSLRNLPGILLLIAPMGTGAITSVLSGLVHDYGASPAQLGFANGWGGGLLTALGALCYLFFPARWNRNIPYALCGILYGAISLLIAAGPLRPSTLIAGMLASNFFQGLVYAAYTGVVLQTLAFAGRCPSSRYTILNSIGNLPVVYMTALLGLVAGHLGTRAVGVVDGTLNFTVAALFFAWYAWVRLRRGGLLEASQPLAGEA
jgi:PAT family beta-lactamase induction signal transducer AmpG